MLPIILLSLLCTSQAISFDQFRPPVDIQPMCLQCCGESPCCNTCGLSKELLSVLRPVAGTVLEGKKVISVKRYAEDLFPDVGGACLDCCGKHPCCSDCGLGDLFKPFTSMPMTTAEPKSPEKEETYESHTNPLGPNIDLGLPHIGPDTDLGRPHLGPDLPHIDLAKPYWELLGKKK